MLGMGFMYIVVVMMSTGAVTFCVILKVEVDVIVDSTGVIMSTGAVTLCVILKVEVDVIVDSTGVMMSTGAVTFCVILKVEVDVIVDSTGVTGMEVVIRTPASVEKRGEEEEEGVIAIVDVS